jgi:hypothetical protein
MSSACRFRAFWAGHRPKAKNSATQRLEYTPGHLVKFLREKKMPIHAIAKNLRIGVGTVSKILAAA